MITTGEPFEMETKIILGECVAESTNINTITVIAHAAGRGKGIVSVQLGEHRVSIKAERLIAAIHGVIGYKIY